MARRWYQTLDIDGVVFEDENRARSNFWNEGKWDNFISPLLPGERQTFIELGCNAGLYLKMAKDAGFQRVIGVEGNGQIMSQAVRYRESIGGDWELIGQKIGHNFDLEKLPLADVVLISNMHYYLPVGVFSKLVDALRNRCLYCIVVSARAKRRQGNAVWEYKSVRGYFNDWTPEQMINRVDSGGDPCPRSEMYGVKYQGNLIPLGVDDYFDRWWEAAKSPGHKSHGLTPAMKDYFENVLAHESFVFEDTQFFQYWRQREPRRSDEWIIKHLKKKLALALDIQKDGMKEPIYLDRRLKLLDGIHRLAIAKVLGHKHILTRIL